VVLNQPVPPAPQRYVLPAPQWYVLRVNSRSEPIAAEALRHKGYQALVPTYTQRKRYSDRVRLVNSPLFPGYVFCAFDIGRKSSVLSSMGVQYIVGTKATPVPLSTSEIDAVMRMCDAGASPAAYLRQGQRARVKFGPLRGIEGIVETQLTVLSIELLQRSISVDIDADQLESIPLPPAPARQSKQLKGTEYSKPCVA
jgi:transcription antitermination factor NusG